MLTEIFWRDCRLADLLGDFSSPGETTLAGLVGSARALAVAAVRRATRRPCLVLGRTEEVASALATDLEFFLREPVALLPEQGTDPDARAGRVAALFRFRTGQAAVLVASVAAALPRTLPPDALEAAALPLFPQRILPRDDLVRRLAQGGYRAVGQVTDPGEFAVRGGIVDCFPSGAPDPVRIEYLGDEIHSLRRFDPESQRSLGPAAALALLPLQELLLTDEAAARLSARLAAAESGAGTPPPPRLLEALEQRRAVPEWDPFLPDIIAAPALLLSYLPPEALIVWDEPLGLEERAGAARREAEEEREREPELLPFLPPLTSCWADWDEFRRAAAAWPRLALEPFAPPPREAEPAPVFLPTGSIDRYHGRMAAFLEELDGWRRRKERIILVARSEAQARRLREILLEHDLAVPIERDVPAPGNVRLWIGALSGGLQIEALALRLITEAEIFDARPGHRRRPHPKEALPFTSFEDLKPGDFVVHLDHGVARYLGLRQLSAGGTEGDFLHLQYAGSDTLYVPVSKFHLVQRYVASDAGGDGPALDRLGGTTWARAKERVRKSIREMAEALLKLYAARQLLPGHAFAADSSYQTEFEAAFPYDETPDQLRAIRDVKRDMEAPRPMDRLVCGDVGYGKTEVALRAAFKAAMDGKQVAVLVPTTVLALQHYQTFGARFASFPVRVEMLSRFQSVAVRRRVLAGLADGSVDVVVGTHRLLQKDVQFSRLGLLIIDEEHRFGVAAKEALKRLRREVDVLTLTATPIPRTLHMTVLGVRDVSTIDTPPEDRLAVRTYITPFDPEILTEALRRELDRGGQVFFVHNRVESIHSMARHIKQWVPEARLAVAHGQMGEAALEKAMVDFYLKKVDILLCTTIIESGLDVASANTIVIDRADTLGLAQLYQLRGRVGRDRLRAHAYLLIPAGGGMTEVARRRLQVMAELQELGAGFKIASRDLEIRGAGNLLGAEQSGHIASVGYDLYCQLIQETIRELKGEPIEPELDPTIRLQVEGHIPEPYVSDPALRLNLYKRLGALREPPRLTEFREELTDRFGPPPPEVDALLEALALKLAARRLKIEEMDARRDAIRVRFAPDPPVSAETIVALLQAERGRLRYVPDNILEYRTDANTAPARLAAARKLLQRLEAGVTVRT